MKLNVRVVWATLAVIACALFATHIVTVILEGEKGRLKRTVYKAKRLTEKESILRLVGYISVDYSDELGNDRRTLLLIAKKFFDEYKNILILIDKLEIEIDGENGAVNVEATIYWQETTSEDIIYDTAEVKAKFKKEERNWKLMELEFLEPEKKRYFHPMVG